MKKNLFKRGAALLLAAVTMLSGCGGGASQEAKTNDIVLAEGTDLKALDPQESGDIYSNFFLKHVYNRLFKLNAENEIECDLAESYEILDDVTYHIVLKQGVKFHDGSELTANDVKFTLERAKEKSNTKVNAENIDTVTVNSDYDLTVTTKAPYPSFLYFLSGENMSIVSESVVSEAEADGGVYGDSPIGTGPFKFVEWAPNDHWTIERFEDYFGEAPLADSLTCRIIPEASARVIALENNEVDAVLTVGAVESANVEANPDLVLESGISPALSYLGLNCRKGPLADKKVRQAISYGINKQEIIDTVLEGQGEVANSYMGKTIPGWNESLEPYPHDPEKAKELLAEAGYGDGFTLKLYASGDQNNRTAQLIQAQLGEIGITVDINMYDWGAFTEAVNRGDEDIFIMGWANRSGDPDYSITPLFHSSSIGFNNGCYIEDAKLDEMIDSAKSEMDSDARMQEYKDIQTYLKELSPMVPLYYSETTSARRADLQGFEFNAAIGSYAGNCHYSVAE